MSAESSSRPAYRIVTPRLVVRCFSPDDAPLVERAIEASLPELLEWMPWAAREPLSREERVAWLRTCRGKFDLDQDFAYGVFAPDGARLIGATGLHARQGPDVREIGYWIGTADGNRGFATEAAAALVQVALRACGMRRVEIRCDPKNARSARVAEKLGFTREGTLRAQMRGLRGEPRDTAVFSMLPDELDASPAARVPVEAYDAVGARLL